MKDFSGERIGNWLVVRYVEYKNSHSIYEVLHEPCGETTTMRLDRLRKTVDKDGCCPFCNPKEARRGKGLVVLTKKISEKKFEAIDTVKYLLHKEKEGDFFKTQALRRKNEENEPHQESQIVKKRKVIITSAQHGLNEAWKYSRGLVSAGIML